MNSNSNTENDTTATIIEAQQQLNSLILDTEHGYHGELESRLASDQQVAPSRPSKLLTQAEESILVTINNCLKNWYKPWRNTFLDDGREFKIVYELMEGLLHYEYQITKSESALSSERTIAIDQAVARLIDYGNAILSIDLVIRANDDAFSDPMRMTTIELFQAHIKAHCLREKLLYDYFKKDKPNANIFVYDQEQLSTINNGPQTPTSPQVHRGSNHSLHPFVVEGRLPKSPKGSSTSINSLALDNGRRTPSQISQGLSPPRELDQNDLSQSVEITHMMATIKSGTFSAIHSSTTRLTLLPGVLSKIESLLSSPSNSIKIMQCFDLLDSLLDSIERLPDESRVKEVSMMSMSLLRHLVHKVYVDDRDDLVQFQHAHWTTCLLSLVRLMGPNIHGYLMQFNNLADLGAFLNDYLFVIKRLLSSSSNRSSTSITGNLDLNDDIQPGSTYPDCWIEMSLLACSTFLSSLTSLFRIVRQYFSTNLSMWLAFIDCLVHFPTHESLRQDRLLMKERQKLRADDIRRISADYVWISWESLSQSQKRQLLEDLMEPLLRASFALQSNHRKVLLPIFYDMMRCDYTVQYFTPRSSFRGSNLTMPKSRDGISLSSINLEQFNEYVDDCQPTYQNHQPISDKGHSFGPASGQVSAPYLGLTRETSNEDGTVLTKFTHLIIGKLNHLILDLKLGDESFTKELCAAIAGDLQYYNMNPSTGSHGDTSQFKSMAKQTSDLVSEFLQICMDCRHANRLVYKHLYLLCLFKLILFFRDKVDRPELYLSNLYKLSHLHHVAQRYVEAGYTLLEHAKSLPWSVNPLDNHYRVVTKFFNISQQQLADSSTLKIFLYNTIMEYFDQGQNWEAAVPLCRELINYYEFKTYEYGKLAQQLDKMSSYFKNISDNNSRYMSEYFRVTFYGKGFPLCLKDMTVVYRGRPYEKLGDFQATIMSKYPDAKPLSTLSKPDSSILEDLEARYLQINACAPVIDLQSKFPGADIKKIREPLLNYYRHNCCGKFQFSRRVNQTRDGKAHGAKVSDDNFANMWRERTKLTTNTFPGMLPFFPVYLIETSIISPIESAIEDLERINDRLATMVNRFKADQRHTEDVRLLGQLLLGVVDAAVNGGISKYEEAFFHSEQQQQHRKEQPSSPTPVGPPGTTTLTSLALPSSPSAIGSATIESSELLAQASNENANTQTSSLVANAATKVVIAEDDQSFKLHDITSNHRSGDASMVDAAQVDKLKYLIAKQVPLLDEAIQLHRDRVAEVMRPQHEHLEASYKKLKHHITTKYYRYLPPEYSKSSAFSTLRSYRSMSRSPRSTLHATDPLTPTVSLTPSSSMRAIRLSSKRMSDVGLSRRGSSGQRNDQNTSSGGEDEQQTSSSIPYRQMANERKKSMPFLTSNEPAQRSNNMMRRRYSSRDGHQHSHHPYEDISDAVSPNSTADNRTASLVAPTQGPLVPPRTFSRNSIKLRLPFGGITSGSSIETRKALSTSVANDESQYMHLIDCDKNDADDEEEEHDARDLAERVEEKPTVAAISGRQLGDADEVDLVSF